VIRWAHRRDAARLTWAALAALAVAVVPACSDDENRLTVYSGRTPELILPLLEDFSDESGIGIDFRSGDSGELALLIDTEGDRSPADVFLSQSPGAVGFLDSAGRLETLGDDVLDLVPADDHAADGSWVGLSGRVRVLVYNTELVDEADLPASVFELTEPEYAGRLAVAPPNASFQDFVTAMRLEVGDDATLDWLEGLAANDVETYPNNVSIVEAVGRGEVEMGLVNHYYNEQALAEDPGLPSENYVFPAGDLGSLLLVTAASVVDTTDQQADAEALIRFLLSEDAQRYFSEETKEYPLAAGVEPDESLPPFDTATATRVAFDELSGLERTEELIDQSGIDD
jgi:iron(III) transport system substrate-binding protein